MKKVFISYKHSDRHYIDQVKSVANNPNHPLNFDDHSLAEAVLNMHGHVNRRQPDDSASQPVKNEIRKRLAAAEKLLVIVGKDTHSSEWVKWELETFERLNSPRNILVMRHTSSVGSLAKKYSRYDIKNWDPKYLSDWINA